MVKHKGENNNHIRELPCLHNILGDIPSGGSARQQRYQAEKVCRSKSRDRKDKKRRSNSRNQEEPDHKIRERDLDINKPEVIG